MSIQKPPAVSVELIEYLEKQFPDSIPLQPLIGVEDLRVLQGQQVVVRLLRRHFDNQTSKVLQG